MNILMYFRILITTQFLFFISCLILTINSKASHFSEPRPLLYNLSQELLQNKVTPSDYSKKLNEMHLESPLNTDELEFLSDVRKLLPLSEHKFTLLKSDLFIKNEIISTDELNVSEDLKTSYPNTIHSAPSAWIKYLVGSVLLTAFMFQNKEIHFLK